MDLKKLNAKLKKAGNKEEQISLLDSYAEQLFGKGKYSEACRYYAKALAMARLANVRAYLAGQIGICNYNLDRDKPALEFLLKAVRLFDPAKPDFMADMCGFVYFHLGSLYEYHGKLSKSLQARQICEKYADSQEKDTKWMLFTGMSRIHEALGRHDEAIRYSQKAIQVLSDDDPGLAYLYESMGSNYMSLKHYPEAIDYFSKVLELDPHFERIDEVHSQMADCYHKLTNHQMALETYLKFRELKLITEKRENLTWIYAKIAHCYFSLDQFEKSLLMTLEGLHRQPKNKLEKAELRSYLTCNFYEMGRHREAVLEGEKTLALARRWADDDLFYFRMALAYHKLGENKSFTRYRNICRKMFPDDGWNKYLEKLK